MDLGGVIILTMIGVAIGWACCQFVGSIKLSYLFLFGNRRFIRK